MASRLHPDTWHLDGRPSVAPSLRESSSPHDEITISGWSRLNDISVEQRPTPSRPLITTRKIPALSLTDNYELVGGIPTFVRRPKRDYEPSFRLFAFSSDGTRMAIVEGARHICVYDAFHFSVVADEGSIGNDLIVNLMFYPLCNDRLIVVFANSTISILKISEVGLKKHGNGPSYSHGTSSFAQVECHQLIEEFEDKHSLCFASKSGEFETWICGWDWSVENVLTICSITQDHGFRRVKIMSDSSILPWQVSMSFSAKALMGTMTLKGDMKRTTTRIWQGIDFAKSQIKMKPIELQGLGFGWDHKGDYLLIWNFQLDGVSKLELYSREDLKSARNSPSTPKFTRQLKLGLLSLKAQFLKSALFEAGAVRILIEEIPIVAYLVVKATDIRLLLWDPFEDDTMKEIDLTMKEMEVGGDSLVDFSISSNLKWVAVGCWTDGTFGLFSFDSCSLVWSTKLDTIDYQNPMFVPLIFDPTNTKLIVNANTTLFVFVPACFNEDLEVQFKSYGIRLNDDSEFSASSLQPKYQKMLPKHILWHLFLLQFNLSALERRKFWRRVDVACSMKTSMLAFLISADRSLSLTLGPLQAFLTPSFRNHVRATITGDQSFHNFDEILVRKDFPVPACLQGPMPLCVFLYFDATKRSELIALFSLDEGILCNFIDPIEQTKQQINRIAVGKWFAINQCKDQSKVACLGVSGTLIVSLVKRTLLYSVAYQADIGRWFDVISLVGKEGPFDISDDGKSILVAWDADSKQRLLLTSSMSDDEFENLNKNIRALVPCWSLTSDLEVIAFWEFDPKSGATLAIGVYNNHDRQLRRVGKEEWNPHMTRVFAGLYKDEVACYALQLDQENGCICVIAIYKEANQCSKLVVIPIGPYSTEGCLPCLCMRDYPYRRIRTAELDEFGTSIFNMPFNKRTSFQLAIENKDGVVMRKLFDSASKYQVKLNSSWIKTYDDQGSCNFLRIAINEKNEAMVKFFLDMMAKHLFSFYDTASIMKSCFKDLWKDYRTFFEPMLITDRFLWNICEIEVPSDIFAVESQMGARTRTFSNLADWENASSERHGLAHWNLHSSNRGRETSAVGSPTKAKAVVKCFSIADACKSGLNGITRFLLMTNAPSYIYRTSLVEWTITWKWEKIWRKRCRRTLLVYVFLVAFFSAYATSIGFEKHEEGEALWQEVLFVVFLMVSVMLVIIMFEQERTQLQTYWNDGKRLFPNMKMWGLRYYFKSRWNWVELITYIMLLTIIPSLHVVSIFYSSCLPWLHTFVAIETILIWTKIWYFAQAFKHTGALVLMIENVVRDCVSFLLLATLVLVGFSFALFNLFRHAVKSDSIQNAKPENDEDTLESIIDRSYGNPLKAMATLFYAMLGTIDIEIYSRCGTLAPLITLIFIAYLATQMIVMLNMLIAVMGDTFDRVKDTEHEQLLMGRARFIDACEASLCSKQIDELEKGIEKYLYVLFPVQDGFHDGLLWRGRVKTLEERVKHIVLQSQSLLVEKIEGLGKCINQRSDNLRKTNGRIEEDITVLKDKLQLLETYLTNDNASVSSSIVRRHRNP